MPDYERRTTTKGTHPPKRWSSGQVRAWHLRVLRSRHARASHRTAALLAHRASRHGANVYGCQTTMAAQTAVCERTVRYHVAQLEAAGLVSVRRCDPERDPATGRWFRRRANAYVLLFPPSPPTGNGLPLRPLRGIQTPAPTQVGLPQVVENDSLTLDSSPPSAHEVAEALRIARSALKRPGR